MRKQSQWNRNDRTFEREIVEPSRFEKKAAQLKLTEDQYLGSRALKMWCRRNASMFYVPEYLVIAWDLNTEYRQSSSAADSLAAWWAKRQKVTA